MSLYETSPVSSPARFRLPVFLLALAALELLVVSLAYQHDFVFTCRATAPAWFCAFAGRIVPRVLGAAAALGLFAFANRAFLANLPWRRTIDTNALMLNAFGVAFVFLPWFILSDASSPVIVLLGALSWSIGGLLATAGFALAMLPAPSWRAIAQKGGLTLAPLVVIAMALPELSELLFPIWNQTGGVTDLTFNAVLKITELMGYDVISIPEDKYIGDDTFAILVGAQCSGIEGFLLITVFLAIYLTLFRDELRFPLVLILFPLGILLSWVFNVARISGLLAIGFNGHPELAVGGFHSHAGWLSFTVLSILMILATRAVPWFNRAAPVSQTASRQAPDVLPFFSDPTVMRILPFLVFMASALVVSTLSQTPGQHYPWRALAMAAALAAFWPTLRTLPWRVDALSVVAGIGIGLLWIVTAPATGSAPYGTLTGTALAIWLVARLLGTTLLVPVIEELFFRDYLLLRLVRSDRIWPMLLAVVVSTVAFAALHDRWILAAIAGLVFAGLTLRSRNVTDAIVAHALANGSIAVWALVTDSWHIL